MVIHLWEQEKVLVKQYAEQYKKQTGDSYSWKHILSLLREHYEEHLDEALKQVMDTKMRELNEEKEEEK